MDEIRSLKERLADAESRLRETERFLADLTEKSNTVMYIKTFDGVYRFVNRKWEEVTGLRREQTLGRTDAELFAPELAEQFRRNDLQVLRSGELVEMEEYLDRPDERRFYLSSKFPVRSSDGSITGLCGISTDITDRKRIDKELRESRERLELAMYATNDGLWDWDIDSGRVYFDPRYYTMAGYEPDEFPHSFDEWKKRVHPEDLPPCKEALRAHFRGETPVFDVEFRFLRKDGSWMWIRGRGKCVEYAEDGSIVRMVGTHIDITELKRQRQEIEYLSFHDHLTGLYNRRFFDEELKRLDTARNLPLTLLLLDVNGLKLTNDAFGHRAGDRLLQTVADLLGRTCREDDIIARIGGDEIAILLPGTDEDAAAALGKRIADVFAAEEVETGPVSASFGWATKSFPMESVENIFRAAEDRMYRQKRSQMGEIRGKSVSFIMKKLYERMPLERLHSERVSELAGKIGAAMGMQPEDVEDLKKSAELHDIGKIAIERDILEKKEPLNENESLMIRRHADIGYSILNSAGGYASHARVALTHQERFDGKGYPKGLRGREIPLNARIVAVANAYDAMVFGRPYRPAIDSAEALLEIQACSGTQFDPEIVEVFLGLFNEGTMESLA